MRPVVDTRAQDDTQSPSPPGDTQPEGARGDAPEWIGRYRVLGIIGQGGMGIVVKAHDPQLVRTVAIKLVRPRPGRDPAASEDRARLLREARALAALSHPNVVPVYDVGEHGDELFVAMQFIAGSNMRVWLDREQPPWKRVLGVFRAAGRGLAAAHAGGMVHRDFKPANVLVGDDGRVRVVDFGLARARIDVDVESDDDKLEVLGGITQSGVLVGTPPYMAPEQFVANTANTGNTGDARADQYAFCVSMFEAFYGALPFTADDLRSLLALKRLGRVPEPGAGTQIPTDLHAAIVRGLAPDPERRFGSMPDLLRELRRIGEASDRVAPAGRSHVAWLIVAIIGLVAVALAIATCDGGR